jgi:hypothetical protein
VSPTTPPSTGVAPGIAPKPPKTGNAGLSDQGSGPLQVVIWIAIAVLLTLGARYAVRPMRGR